MDRIEQLYYQNQIKARGLMTADALRQNFSMLIPWYSCILKDRLPKNKHARILDLPCGYGNFLFFLRAKGYTNAIGYDRDVNQIQLARALELNATEGEAFSMLQNDTTGFHCIASIDFLEHLSKNDAFSFLELAKSRIRPGGMLILRTPCSDGPFGSHDRDNDITHKWNPTSTVLATLLDMAGFTEISIIEERPHAINFLGLVKVILFHPARWLATIFLRVIGLEPPKVWSRGMWAVARVA